MCVQVPQWILFFYTTFVIQLYASPWFMTVFANRLELPILLRLWDHLLIHSEPLAFYFFCVALLSKHAEELMSYNPVVLPEKLSQLTVTTLKDVGHIIYMSAHCIQSPFVF